MYHYDSIVVGAGLAGASAAFWLSHSQCVLVLDKGTSTSSIAAGLINPIVGRHAKWVWRSAEALDALHETLFAAQCQDLFAQTGVVRLAMESQQADCFRSRASTLADSARWLTSEETKEQFPFAYAPHGALHVKPGGIINVNAYTQCLLRAAERNSAVLWRGVTVDAWGEDGTRAHVRVLGETITAKTVILALGYGYRQHKRLCQLNLRANKGQLVRVARVPCQIPLSGNGYVVPTPTGTWIGTTYEHEFKDLQPTKSVTSRLLAAAATMVPALEGALPKACVAGARVTVPRKRLPVVGPLPGSPRVWVYTGLGSKGLLHSALISHRLPSYLRDPGTIPAQIATT